jgi:ABC-type transport system involved in Fe-S cluster assembly fused permease/ATPase subunit
MTEPEVKATILKIFTSERKNPDAPYDESHFMDFLLNRSIPKNDIKNSFSGVKKYHIFMDKLELEFGICFSLADLDRTYSVDQLTKKVLQRIKKGKGNKMILKMRIAQKDTYNIEITLVVILVGLYFWLGIHWVPILCTILFGIAIYWIVSSKINNQKHLKKMKERLGMHATKAS